MGDARVDAKITAGIMRIVSSVVDDVQRGDLVNRSDAISRRHALRKIDAPGNGRCWPTFKDSEASKPGNADEEVLADRSSCRFRIEQRFCTSLWRRANRV